MNGEELGLAMCSCFATPTSYGVGPQVESQSWKVGRGFKGLVNPTLRLFTFRHACNAIICCACKLSYRQCGKACLWVCWGSYDFVVVCLAGVPSGSRPAETHVPPSSRRSCYLPLMTIKSGPATWFDAPGDPPIHETGKKIQNLVSKCS